MDFAGLKDEIIRVIGGQNRSKTIPSLDKMGQNSSHARTKLEGRNSFKLCGPHVEPLLKFSLKFSKAHQVLTAPLCPFPLEAVPLSKFSLKFSKAHQVLIAPLRACDPLCVSQFGSSRCFCLSTGGKKYHIKGCAGQGGFAQVYKAYVNSDSDTVVALKVVSTHGS
ncbi:hypothetical protein RJT34_02463 [Clitoria ternatea]|uniref:Protein kinase domain-containing protein n=1 Tax=Clitoria ternatea TaxID=43366 RepID=A0AAN9KH95_CLITE